MRVSMPRGNTHGWGIAGTHLAAEIAKLPPVEGVTLHSVAGHHFAPSHEQDWDRVNIGYCFFESEIIAYRFIPEAARRWDHIVAGSSWCEHHLRIAGMNRTSTILQGIDPATFHAVPTRAPDGRFIVFSGGKFEYRKGHDLVIAAMREFMATHHDVWLACSWHNHWPMSIKTMEESRIINFSYRDAPCDQLFLTILAENGIPTDRVIMYPVLDNLMMQQAYAASDVGLFPNRCEGGNNMVMCEYMACGRPVIAAPLTGHMDVITPRNALQLRNVEPIVAMHGGSPAGVWFESSVQEMVDLLHQAYSNRTRLSQIGAAAADSMKALSWSAAAAKFHEIAERLRPAPASVSTCSPASPSQERAAALFHEGKFEEALGEFRRLLQAAPLDPHLHSSIGTVLDRLERYAEAVVHYEKALSLQPQFVEARFNLGNTLQRMGRSREAIEHLRLVVAAAPRFKEAWQNLALCLFDVNDLTASAEALGQVLEIDPSCHKSRADLGEILIELRRYHDALACFDAVLADHPGDASVLHAKGVALQWLNDLDGAEQCYQLILQGEPGNALALNNIGAIMRSRGNPQEAIACFDRALEAAGDDASIRFNRSLAHLQCGDFDRGWREYEYRFHRSSQVQLRHSHLPRWQGQDLSGKTILLWCEQGYGDSIQFIRYARMMADCGAQVIVEAQDQRIAPLLVRAGGVSRVFVKGDQLPSVDYQIPLLSIPAVLGNLPCPGHYLDVREEEVRRWDSLLDPHGRMKIGLAWAGRPTHLDDRLRSIPPHLFAPLGSIGEALFVSLQFSPAEEMQVPHLLHVRDQVETFVDSASLVAALDLVITVDSAVAHLAGALGVPTWILLPKNPDWRWLLERKDSPWYRSVRLFRQDKAGDWPGVMEAVSDALQETMKQRKK